MDLRLNVNNFQLQRELKKAEKEEKKEDKPVEEPKAAPEAKPVTAGAADVTEALGRGMVSGAAGAKDGGTKDDDYIALVKQWNALISDTGSKFPYEAKLKLLDAILKVAPKEEVVRWTLVKIETIQNKQQSVLNYYNQHPENCNFDEVLEPWQEMLAPGSELTLSSDLVELWNTAGAIYGPDYSSQEEYNMVVLNIQSWEIAKTVLELKMKDPRTQGNPSLLEEYKNRLNAFETEIKHWKEELEKYHPTH